MSETNPNDYPETELMGKHAQKLDRGPEFQSSGAKEKAAGTKT